MPAKASNPSKRSTPKKKPTAKANATERIARRPGTTPPVRIPASSKQSSQKRFPGETPLTGEDRPLSRARGKKEQPSPTRRTTAKPGHTPQGKRQPMSKATGNARQPSR